MQLAEVAEMEVAEVEEVQVAEVVDEVLRCQFHFIAISRAQDRSCQQESRVAYRKFRQDFCGLGGQPNLACTVQGLFDAVARLFFMALCTAALLQ